jgi:hypothetical protein
LISSSVCFSNNLGEAKCQILEYQGEEASWICCLHFNGLHSHCLNLGEDRRPIKMPSAAIQTPISVKIASFDHPTVVSWVDALPLRCVRAGLRGRPSISVAQRSKSRTCEHDRAIALKGMYSSNKAGYTEVRSRVQIPR